MSRPATLEPNRSAAFNLTDRQIAWIQEQAEKRGVSKATIVREAVETLRKQDGQPKKEATA